MVVAVARPFSIAHRQALMLHLKGLQRRLGFLKPTCSVLLLQL